MDDWEIKWKEDCRKNAIKAAKLWKEKYSKMEPIEKFKEERYRTATFLDAVVTKDDVVLTKTTRITWTKNPETKETEMSIWSGTSKAQRFLVVGGPQAGTKQTEEQAGPEFVLYNCGGRYRHQKEKPPHVILVYKELLK